MAPEDQNMHAELNSLKDSLRALDVRVREQFSEMRMSVHDQISEVKAETHGIKNNMQAVIGYSEQIRSLANKLDSFGSALNEHKLTSERSLALALTELRADLSSLKVSQAITSTQIVTGLAAGGAVAAALMGLAKVLFI